MRGLSILSLMLVSAAFAQQLPVFPEFSEGRYAANPFTYSPELSEAEIADLVRQVEAVTDNWIESIYHTSPELIVGGDEVHVQVCRSSNPAEANCDHGDFYAFVRANPGWKRKNQWVGTWIY